MQPVDGPADQRLQGIDAHGPQHLHVAQAAGPAGARQAQRRGGAGGAEAERQRGAGAAEQQIKPVQREVLGLDADRLSCTAMYAGRRRTGAWAAAGTWDWGRVGASKMQHRVARVRGVLFGGQHRAPS